MTSPRTLLTASNIRAKKQLGQHFLTDPAAAKMIVSRSGISSEDVVLEIGAGLGALTVPAATIAKKVYAIEKDRQIAGLLKTELFESNLSNVVLIEKSILNIEIQELTETINSKIVVIGNLPYNISSQILVQLVMSRSVIKRAILMFQKELAKRLTAQPGGKDYGRITVMLNYCAHIKKLADVNAVLFFPRPRVDSEVLEIKFKQTPKYPAIDEHFFFRVVKAAFSKRRKTLKNALSGSELNIDAKTALDILENTGIDSSRRAETLNISEFVALSNRLGSVLKEMSKSTLTDSDTSDLLSRIRYSNPK